MKTVTIAAIGLVLVAVGLAGCAEDQAPATAAEAPAARPARAQPGWGMCPMMAGGVRPMGQAKAVRVTAIGPGPAGAVGTKDVTIAPTACPYCPMRGGGMMANAMRSPFGPAGAQARQGRSQVVTGQFAVARIESLAARKDSPVDGIELLMRIAGSDAPAAVRRSAAFAVSRLHEKAGNLDKAAQILARITLLPDDPRPQVRAVGRAVDRPMPSDQAPQEVREAAERLEHRRRELDELARQLEQQRRELGRQQRELEQLARRLSQGEHDDD